MGLFRKKKRSNFEINEFNKEKVRGLLTSFDKMEYFVFSERSDDKMFELCQMILNHKPVLANFDKVQSNADCNYMLAFISGVVYARDGQAIQVGPKLFLFGGKEEFEDGSLFQYVEDIK